MSITPRSWVATCNHRGDDLSSCTETLMLDDYNELVALMDRWLWQHSVNRDGTPGKNNRSYCPKHRRPRP